MDPAQEIELNALARQKPMNDVIDLRNSPVQLFYRGATVFMTGGSGFLGKQLIEKLFRSCDIEKLYLLMRAKKSKTIQERLSSLFQDPVFDSLRAKQPDFAEKIFPIEGNTADIRLGISDNDWILLTKEVNFIFNVAATVRFDEQLRKATFTNIRSTREVLELARNCNNFKKLVHVSTAFSFATKSRSGTEIFEQFYSCPVPPDVMISLAENIDETKLDNMKDNLIDDWPNTYTFTKCIAEELIRTRAGDLPVCIVRPPIVLPAYYEPAPGWLDVSTIMGPSGIYFGAGLGVLRVVFADTSSNIAIAPIDYVNNTIIAAAWDSTERRSNGKTDIPIYTVATDIRYGLIPETAKKEKWRMASPKAVWATDVFQTNNKLLYKILSLLMMYIPAYTVDFICSILGKKPAQIPSFVELLSKMDKLNEVYMFYTRNAFKFRGDNVIAMINRMNDADTAIYNCNLDDMDKEDYIRVWGIGLRKYIAKDGLRGTKRAYRKLQILAVLDHIVIALYAYSLWWIFSSLCFVIKSIIFQVFYVTYYIKSM